MQTWPSPRTTARTTSPQHGTETHQESRSQRGKHFKGVDPKPLRNVCFTKDSKEPAEDAEHTPCVHGRGSEGLLRPEVEATVAQAVACPALRNRTLCAVSAPRRVSGSAVSHDPRGRRGPGPQEGSRAEACVGQCEDGRTGVTPGLPGAAVLLCRLYKKTSGRSCQKKSNIR